MDPTGMPRCSSAGIISSIRLENFMCHSSIQIELCDWVNFVTGQNGSGKSAILTALCVAFGCRAKGTQRASSLKDFIKTGCSYASVTIGIKNKGDDAFKPDIYGDLIILERRITESTSSTILKDRQGKKVSHKMSELRELVEHFNIDVENPCVIMSQDKSREFLHSGNDKDKFKFFFKATLLQQVYELLQSIRGHLDSANATVDELEASIRPIQKELGELREKIKSMEHVEEIAQQVQILKKKLAWSWVYDVDRQIVDQKEKLEKLRDRIPACQARIDTHSAKLEELKGFLLSKKTHIASLMEKTSDVRRMKDELQQDLSLATKEKYELQEQYARQHRSIQNMAKHARSLQQQIEDIQQQHLKNTQAEETELKGQLGKLQDEIDEVQSRITRLLSEENALSEKLSAANNEVKNLVKEIEEHERKRRDLSSQIRQLQQRQRNKVTAFGGERVLSLLRVVERRHRGFRSPPIGPIGAHVTLVNGDFWALAVESAIGRLLDAFIVTDHKDAHLLRSCAKEANYNNLQIIIYDFSRPRLNIPTHMLPSTNHPTILSVLQSDNPTVMNALVDMGSVERHVLVRDYEIGKSVAFEERIQNLRDVYTSDGFKMFRRGYVETVLPPNRRGRAVRLCGSVDDFINDCERESAKELEFIQEGKKRKRNSEEEVQNLNSKMQSIKRQRVNEQNVLLSKQVKLRDVRNTYITDGNADPANDVGELNQEILRIEEDMKQEEISLEKVQISITRAEEKVNDLKMSYEKLCDSAKGEVDAIEESEKELLLIEQNICSSEGDKSYYEKLMSDKVLDDVKKAEETCETLQLSRQENFKKASIICPEHEVESLGGCAGNTPENLSAQLSRLKQRLRNETGRYSESIYDLRMMYAKKERKISKKQTIYEAFREKLNACQKALDLRWSKFQRNANLLKRQLTWQFNGHLRKKGISGQIKVDYDEKILSVEVKMPQDASGKTVRDTRGLSGGERSFSTLCFALALHEMTEAPFRAMDEFDVFMDAISRKISLDTLVDFALSQGSQWILITPHDISMVQPGERIKKQQMAAPRS